MKNLDAEQLVWTRCVCPECGLKYSLHMFFTGRGDLRRYCDNCRANIGKICSTTVGMGALRSVNKNNGSE